MRKVYVAELNAGARIDEIRRALADLCAARDPRIVRNSDPEGPHSIRFEPSGGGTTVELTVATGEDGKTRIAALDTSYASDVIDRLTDRFGGRSGRDGSDVMKIGASRVGDTAQDVEDAWRMRARHGGVPERVAVLRKNAVRACVFVDDIPRATIERNDVAAAEKPWLVVSGGRRKARFGSLDAVFSSLDPDRLAPGRADKRAKSRKSWNEVIQEMAAGGLPERPSDAGPPFRGSISSDEARNLDLVRLDRLPDYVAAVEAEAARADDEFRSADAILWDGLGEILRNLDRHLRSAAAEIGDRKAESDPAPKP